MTTLVEILLVTVPGILMLGTLYAVLREWRAIRAEKGLFPFDHWTYEDEPWRSGTEDGEEE